MAEVLIIGFGDIGRRVARLELARGNAVAALVRDASRLENVRSMGIEPYLADLDRPETLAALPCAGRRAYYFAPPPEHGEHDPRLANWLAGLESGRLPAKVVYISTTGVYGDSRGAWVDEDTPPNPQTDRARRRLDAESRLRAFGRARGVPVVILRVPGIYGPGRLPLEPVRAGRPVVRASEAAWSNRIHADDLAQVCIAAAERGQADRIYNAGDGEQSTMSDYFCAIAAVYGLPAPPEISLEEARHVLSPGLLSYLNESRRVSNRRMLEELGVVLRYPTLVAGLRAIRAQESAGSP